MAGPTAAGGVYAVLYFSYDGTPVPQRFANQVTIIEYDEHDQALNTTLGVVAPEEAMPSSGPLPEFDEARPQLGGAAGAAALFLAKRGRWRFTPRRRPIEKSPASLETQAVCLARSWVGRTPGQSAGSAALSAAASVLENRQLENQWVAVEVGASRYFLRVSSTGAARCTNRLPDGVDASEVFQFNATDHLAYGEQRIRDVMRRLETSDKESAFRDEALTLARHAVSADRFAKGVWDELLRAARAFVDYFQPRDRRSLIPVPMALEALRGLKEDALNARRALGLDCVMTGAACLIGSLGTALAARSDAHVRWYYHPYAKSLASIPEQEQQNLHRVADLMVRLVAAEGLDTVVTELAQRSTKKAEDLIQRALASDDLDDFYWLLYEALVPLQVAETVYHALASMERPAMGADRMANLIEEKSVRIETSLSLDSDHLYLPWLATWYRDVQHALEAEGPDAVRREVFELSGHTLSLPTSVAQTLKVGGLDGEELWEQLMRSRFPLKSPHAPSRRTGEATDG